jgi:glucose-1-phosphate thymidylyltransferase
MKQKGTVFVPGKVDEWLDCGNKNATVYTNQRVLEFLKEKENTVADDVVLENSVVIPPCYIGKNVTLKNAVIGPHVSIGDHSTVSNSVISNSIVQTNTTLSGLNLTNSMVGNHVNFRNEAEELSVGDYNTKG